MRYLLLFMPTLSLVTIAGCSQDTADWNQLSVRNGLFFKDKATQPFTGVARDRWPNGQTRIQEPLVKGKQHGWSTSWYEDGKKSSEGKYEFGEQVGTWKYWDANGNEMVSNMDE